MLETINFESFKSCVHGLKNQLLLLGSQRLRQKRKH